MSTTPRGTILLRTLLALVLLALTLPQPRVAAEPDETLTATITEHVAKRYHRQSVQKAIDTWGDDCVPILIQLLDAQGENAQQVAFYLGLAKDPAAVDSLIRYIERNVATENSDVFGYLALGWIGTPKALKYLEACAADPKQAPHAVSGLAVAESREALAALERIDRSNDGQAHRTADLTSALKRCREAVERREGVARARAAAGPLTEAQQAFWAAQESALPENPAKEILGTYHGSAYWTDYPDDRQTAGITLTFKKKGVFETNLPSLVSAERLSQPGLGELLDEPVTGTYHVLGPTQLILGPGEGVVTHGFSLEEGRLSFYHRRLQAFFSLGTRKAKTRVHSTASIAGVYTGPAMVTEESGGQLQRIPDAELVFTDNGYFNTNFGSEQGKLFLGVNTLNGRYRVDDFGKLVCYMRLEGGDFYSFDTVSFFDWHVRNGALHGNHFQGAYYGCAMVLGAPSPFKTPPDLLARLTASTYRGRAFAPTPEGDIREVHGIKMTFEQDGTYHGNLHPRQLRPGQQYYPDDAGKFVVLSDRQLYLADSWGSDSLTNQGVCDVLITEDRLYFSSIRRRAYFVLQQGEKSP